MIIADPEERKTELYKNLSKIHDKEEIQSWKGWQGGPSYPKLTDEQRLERLTDLIAEVVVDEVLRKMKQRKFQEKPPEIEHLQGFESLQNAKNCDNFRNI